MKVKFSMFSTGSSSTRTELIDDHEVDPGSGTGAGTRRLRLRLSLALELEIHMDQL